MADLQIGLPADDELHYSAPPAKPAKRYWYTGVKEIGGAGAASGAPDLKA
jgi:hypothetical protein